jgi:hypothetical protein
MSSVTVAMPTITVTRLYSDDQGVSHFQTLHLPADQKIIPLPHISSTKVMSAEGFIISRFNHNFFWDWHTPPEKGHFLDIILIGQERIDASDGTSKVFKPGDMLLLEDNSGNGHRAQALTNGEELTIKLTSEKPGRKAESG